MGEATATVSSGQSLLLPILLTLLVIVIVVAIFLFVRKFTTTKKQTQITLQRIEHKLDLILEENKNLNSKL